MSDIEHWCREHAITEIEALMPDMSGVARGKIMPVAAYCRTLGLNLPEALVLQTVTGDYPEDQSAVDPSDRDMVLRADEGDHPAGSLGGGAHRTGHPRLLRRRRRPGDHHPALRVAQGARSLS